MVHFPVLQEISTFGATAGLLIAGDVPGARKVWFHYATESVIGSAGVAMAEAIRGDMETGRRDGNRYGCGCGRALGRRGLGGQQRVAISHVFNRVPTRELRNVVIPIDGVRGRAAEEQFGPFRVRGRSPVRLGLSPAERIDRARRVRSWVV